MKSIGIIWTSLKLILVLCLCMLAGCCAIVGIGVLCLGMQWSVLYSVIYIILANWGACVANDILKGIVIW